MARIAVVGAGVVGVVTAYLLARAGHEVTILDASHEPGRGASAGNAAQLSWAYGDVMASPALLRHLPAILAGRDAAGGNFPQLLDSLAVGLRIAVAIESEARNELFRE